MKTKKINLNLNGKRVPIELNILPKYLHWKGLMFKSRETAKALLFKFNKPTKIGIHSDFVSFEFIAIWFDSLWNILDAKEITPGSKNIYPKREFMNLIEVPNNKEYKKIYTKLLESLTTKNEEQQD